ncbi:M23 family metallopeptidase [Fulvivirga sp. 29W222]|uniref:M23 family metallopeptidase n=1 Tax=Fulvivirga marina TaxID=2494733 RepID=A0A937G3I0_9BACT|nr:M23 family metallopeptidase [Fulvivirga marina]MBL6450027.1 M23 family metallopeptidase [Fulvivirga marina]
MKLGRNVLLVIVALLSGTVAKGQLEENHIYRENYYLFPIKPGVRNTLAGTMGELRSSHFHSGIDIRTESRIGLAVYAAANGFISRVAVSTSGYGNALYIQHPNGHTTVYAHLDHFTGAVAEYVKEEQYKRKTFELNLYFRKGQFKVSKGDIIAYGGNSGSSGGPHLHFDVRDKNQKPLNPLKYGFDEIWDRTPPVAHKLALKTLDKDARVNGQFGRFEFKVRRTGNNYVIDQPIEISGAVGAELYAYDKLDNSRFRCGINLITMSIDDKEIFKSDISTFSFAETRNILKHMNYPDLYETGERFHKLYVDDGNRLKFYSTDDRKGRISINGNDEHVVKVVMTDSYNNVSNLKFKLKAGNSNLAKSTAYGHSSGSEIELTDNTLVIKAPLNNNSSIVVYTPEMHELQPAYVISDNQAVYLWNMKDGLPHSIDINGTNELLHYKEMVKPDVSYRYYSDKMDIYFPKDALFDTLYLQSLYSYIESDKSEEFLVGDQHIPLRKYISITLKPQISFTEPEKYSVYAINNKGHAFYKGGKWEYGRVTFWTRNFGKFAILEDSTPPRITPIMVTPDELKFKISDERSGIDSFKCYVNNEWVLMNYDYKTHLIWSEKLDISQPFSGEVKLIVTDNQGNEKIYTSKL